MWYRKGEFPGVLKDYPKVNITVEGGPVAVPRRQMPDELEEAAEAMTKEMIKWGVVEESRSPWATNVVMVKN